MASCNGAAAPGAIAESEAIKHDAVAVETTFFMRRTMTGQPEPEKPPTFKVWKNAQEDGAQMEAAAFVSESLGVEIAARFGPRDESPFSILAYDGETLVGGILGSTHWRWRYVRHFWVAEKRRGRGVGHWLLAQAETEARAQNCVGLYLDTFDPHIVRFYERCGFVRFGCLSDFPPGHARTFLYKKLLGL